MFLITRITLQVGNVEVAAVSGEVVSVVSAEKTSDQWKNLLEEDEDATRKALETIHDKWEVAIKHEVAENIYSDLCDLKGKFFTFLCKSRN